MGWFSKKEETKLSPTSTILPSVKMPIVVTTRKGDSVLHRIVTEADIRTEAYYLWEKAGKVGSSEQYWHQAEEKIKKLLLSESDSTEQS